MKNLKVEKIKPEKSTSNKGKTKAEIQSKIFHEILCV